MSEHFKFSQDFTAYKPKTQKVYPIQEYDWKKLKSMTSECFTPGNLSFKDTGLILIGGSISALLSLVAIHTSPDVANWIITINWIVFICTALIGLSFLFFDKSNVKKLNRDIQLVIDEMEHIEGKYYLTQSEETKDKSDSKDEEIKFLF